MSNKGILTLISSLTGHISDSTTKLIDMSIQEVNRESVEIIEDHIIEMTALSKAFSIIIQQFEYKER